MFKTLFFIVDNQLLMLARVALMLALPVIAFKYDSNFGMLVFLASLYDMLCLIAAHVEDQDDDGDDDQDGGQHAKA